MAKRTAERIEFLSDSLLDALVASGYWRESAHETDENVWELTDIDGETHTVTLDTMARGWNALRVDSMRHSCGDDYIREAMLANRTNGADGDYDAEVTDVVLQLGLFGGIIYG